jgi:hypothetical protein
MFLFTTPAARDPVPAGGAQGAATPVQQAIRRGAERTGVNFDYLLKTAQRESALDPEAKAATSSATGLFQFIDQTWLSMMRAEGPNHGLADAARAIGQSADGRLTVADPAMREQIMALRRDPQVASVMAGAFTQRNRETLSGALGREPDGGELYTAHVLGARGATELINAAATSPGRPAMQLFPDAAGANRSIFFDRAGRARSAAEVLDVLTAQHRAIAQVRVASGQGGSDQPDASGPPGGRKGLMGLFSTEGSRAPVSDAVARVWSGQRARGVQLASLEPAQRFFPTSGSVAAAPTQAAGPANELAAVTTGAGAGRLADAPKPPSRPSDLAAEAGASPRAKQSRQRPLNLNAFIRPGGAT